VPIISAAFSFGIKSEHNYTGQEIGGRWGIKVNPVAASPTDPEALNPGNRYLTTREFKDFWDWLAKNRDKRETWLQPYS
jgi:hypothetical protein